MPNFASRCVSSCLNLAASRLRRGSQVVLSGGEQQRVAIARALVLEPTAVLLDEPLSNLDVVLAGELADLFRSLFAKRRTAALYVTHDPREAEQLASRIAVIEAGRITQLGSIEELRARSATRFVARAFGGTAEEKEV